MPEDYAPKHSLAASQTAHPWRATLRTALQVGIPVIFTLGIVVPQVVDIVLEETGARTTVPAWLTATLFGLSAVVTGLSAVLARVMAIPAVNAWLSRNVEPLAAAPHGEEIINTDNLG